MLPSAAAAKYLRTEKGAWDPALTPMMIEPLDLLSGRDYTGIVFVGPARSGKTMSLLLAGITYVVTCAPGDMLVVQMSQDAARDFSRTDLDRAIRHSPELCARMSPRARDDNTFDKFWRSGIILKLGWPAVSQVSSKTIRYAFSTDYDRPGNRDDVDGEGPLWDLLAKRIETMMSRGKVLAESSPGGEYLDAQWRPSTPHEAPPAQGILSLYNRGTRARWYWPCLECGEFFQAEPGLGNFGLPPFDELQALVQTEDLSSLADKWSRLVCKACGALHELHHRPEMNSRGRWLHEGQRIEGGQILGERRRTQIASFWLGGVAAAYQRWDLILLKYLQALRSYVSTKDESPLKATTNTDQAAPYLPRVVANRRSADHLKDRAEQEDWPRGTVPADVRFLTAAVDVQGNRFVVEVFGWGEGLESWIVDRFSISSSKRPEGDRYAALDPASYEEDWDVLLDQVIGRKYPVHGVPGATMKPRITLCDQGGREGVTNNAYQFWRRCRSKRLGQQFMLIKGTGNPNAARCVKVWPDARHRRDRASGGRGDVPVWLVNTNVMKDGVVGDLGRDDVGPGYVHIPSWIDPVVFDEYVAEQRTDKGWVRPTGLRNEALDLHVYNRAAVIAINAEKINWQRPPTWARPAEPSELMVEPPPDQPEVSKSAAKSPPVPRPPRPAGFINRKGSWFRK
jgi:phage terminase large subunit GpA-like protein